MLFICTIILLNQESKPEPFTELKSKMVTFQIALKFVLWHMATLGPSRFIKPTYLSRPNTRAHISPHVWTTFQSILHKISLHVSCKDKTHFLLSPSFLWTPFHQHFCVPNPKFIFNIYRYRYVITETLFIDILTFDHYLIVIIYKYYTKSFYIQSLLIFFILLYAMHK